MYLGRLDVAGMIVSVSRSLAVPDPSIVAVLGCGGCEGACVGAWCNGAMVRWCDVPIGATCSCAKRYANLPIYEVKHKRYAGGCPQIRCDLATSRPFASSSTSFNSPMVLSATPPALPGRGGDRVLV